MLKLLLKIWAFTAHLAYVITKIDELVEQGKVFYDWLRYGDEPNDPPEPTYVRRKKRKRESNKAS